MSTEQGPSAAVRAWVASQIPGVTGFVEHTVPFGQARVWAVRRGTEVVAWLKRHRSRDAAQRERVAYEQWLPQVGWGTPVYLGACPDSPSTLLTLAAPGVRADRARLDPARRVAVFREVGRFVAALHAVPLPEADPLPLDEALRLRAASWCDRASGVIPDELTDVVRERFDRPFPELRRVPCHRDLQLHNVLVHGDPPAITVIDFGQARPDVWLADLVKLFQRPDRVAPAEFQAFLEGYGRRLRSGEHEVLARLRLLHGLATWVWADEHGDTAGALLGRRVLEAAVDALGQ